MKQMKLLSEPNTNTKLAKSGAYGYHTYSLALAPHNVSGYNVCAHASTGCSGACVSSSGRGKIRNVIDARVRRTKLFFEDRKEFMRQLEFEIGIAIATARHNGYEPAFRLNTFSDINWENYGVIQKFPDVAFYDYSKNYQRMLRYAYGSLPDNYHLTFSRSESNDVDVQQVMRLGRNVAVVFNEVPAVWHGKTVVDGDEHDLRFLDPEGVVVGLKVKGDGKKDSTGFVL